MDTVPNTTGTLYESFRQNNIEDLYASKNDDGVRLFSEGEFKNYTHQY